MDLFSAQQEKISIAPGAMLLKAFVEDDAKLLAAIETVTAAAPFRHMVTPGGFRMSVAMTNCGALGWVADRKGYRYAPLDPETGNPWPAMPPELLALAQRAADAAGYPGFTPQAALINRYDIGAKLSLHQDKDEAYRAAPVVSVSLGIPATFVFGGLERADPKQKMTLEHGDVVVWGGPSRLAYHAILPLKAATHPQLGPQRINLTFRKVS